MSVTLHVAVPSMGPVSLDVMGTCSITGLKNEVAHTAGLDVESFTLTHDGREIDGEMVHQHAFHDQTVLTVDVSVRQKAVMKAEAMGFQGLKTAKDLHRVMTSSKAAEDDEPLSEIIKIFSFAGILADDNTLHDILKATSWCGFMKCAEALLTCTPVPVNRVDSDWGETVLHYAAYHGCAPLATLLLKHGADPNIPNEEGMTALHNAALVGDSATVAALIEHGGDPRLEDENGATAAHIALCHDHHVIVNMLQGRVV
eukprot:TRINITY_DN2773_c0_g2_i1.p1 TRINITY_DN2773_c0_g2~~TRINITY_DN2773_c0_g2_i1.p1  ORF type:complete len:257 (+),score=39.16 TRINITY_DN2773_c0_g2_i1:61-831(+)